MQSDHADTVPHWEPTRPVADYAPPLEGTTSGWSDLANVGQEAEPVKANQPLDGYLIGWYKGARWGLCAGLLWGAGAAVVVQLLWKAWHS